MALGSGKSRSTRTGRLPFVGDYRRGWTSTLIHTPLRAVSSYAFRGIDNPQSVGSRIQGPELVDFALINLGE